MVNHRTALDVKQILKLGVIYKVSPLWQSLTSGDDHGLSP